jgi:iron complex outermembrane receptor protein
MSRKLALVGVLGVVASGAAHAQQTAPAQAPAPAAQAAPAAQHEPDDTEVEAVTITASGKPFGAVVGDIKPEETFNMADIRSFGVSSMEDLLSELTPQTTSGLGGSPVVLLNGRRISGMGEIRDIPTEAIQRVEVLPEEVALKYGYPADQKVVNVVLRQRFRASTVDGQIGGSTQGGQLSQQGAWSQLQLNRQGRTNLSVKIQNSDWLRESDRDLISNAQSGLYDFVGNVATPNGDPLTALSALAGTPVTVVGVPGAAANGALPLSAFLPGANQANTSDLSDSRTLLPASQQVSINSVTNRYILDNVSATLNLSLTGNKSESLSGPARALLRIPGASPFSPFGQDVSLYRYLNEFPALSQTSRSLQGHAGFTLNKDTEALRLSLTGNYDRTISRTLTDRGVDLTGVQSRLTALDANLNPFAALGGLPVTQDRARSTTDAADLQFVANRALAKLAAGDLSSTLKLGVSGSRLKGTSIRSGVEVDSEQSRGDASAQVSFDLPLASRRKGVRAGIGDLSTNVNFAARQVSDFGTLTTIGGGVNWSPLAPISFTVQASRQENAPSIAQLGNPLVTTPDARVFDYVRGQTVDVTRITGGNADLLAEQRNTLRFGVNYRPTFVTGLTLNANYSRTRIDNPVATFPAATAAVEAAFPDRFQRNADGDLVRIDTRPVNFLKRDSEQIRWGFNFSRQIGKAPPPPAGGWRRQGQAAVPGGELLQQRGGQSERDAPRPPTGENEQPGQQARNDETPRTDGAPPSDAPRNFGGDGPRGPGGPGGFGPGGGGFGGRGGGGFGNPRATRLQLSVYHTVRLSERVVVADGIPALDLLDGDVLGSGGGQPRNEIEAQAGLTRYGLGARLTANWKEASQVRRGLGGASSDLDFSSLATVNLRLFADLGIRRELVQKHPILRGTRVTLAVNNLFDERQTVTDATGTTPINYQPDYLDPRGRVVQFSVRKLLF